MLETIKALIRKHEDSLLNRKVIVFSLENFSDCFTKDTEEKLKKAGLDFMALEEFLLILVPETLDEEELISCILVAESKDEDIKCSERFNVFQIESHPLYDSLLSY